MERAPVDGPLGAGSGAPSGAGSRGRGTASGEALAREILLRLRDVPDFPEPGILFKDLTPLWRDADLYRRCVHALAERFRHARIQAVVGIEARGFLFAAPLALELGAGLVPARKPGKLPAARISRSYALEYGQAALELHRDAIAAGERVLVADDLLATGGTAAAAAGLVEDLGGRVVALTFAVELAALHGRACLPGYEVFSLAAVGAPDRP